jgi:hypothetical protein
MHHAGTHLDCRQHVPHPSALCSVSKPQIQGLETALMIMPLILHPPVTMPVHSLSNVLPISPQHWLPKGAHLLGPHASARVARVARSAALCHVIKDGLRPRLQLSNLPQAPLLPRPACNVRQVFMFHPGALYTQAGEFGDVSMRMMQQLPMLHTLRLQCTQERGALPSHKVCGWGRGGRSWPAHLQCAAFLAQPVFWASQGGSESCRTARAAKTQGC